MDKKYYVYVLTNYSNTVFYTGMTNNLEKRVWEHKKKVNPDSFTSRYKVYKLVWFEEFDKVEDAIRIEKKVKDMNRLKKIELISLKNKLFYDLYSLR